VLWITVFTDDIATSVISYRCSFCPFIKYLYIYSYWKYSVFGIWTSPIKSCVYACVWLFLCFLYHSHTFWEQMCFVSLYNTVSKRIFFWFYIFGSVLVRLTKRLWFSFSQHKFCDPFLGTNSAILLVLSRVLCTRLVDWYVNLIIRLTLYILG
jgi:hypothetical protein